MLPLADGAVVLSTNGSISTDFIIPSQRPATGYTAVAPLTYNYTVTAAGSVAGSASVQANWPQMKVRVDGVLVKTTYVTSATETVITFPAVVSPAEISAGMHKISFEFSNDAVVGNQDRNLYIKRFEVKLPSPVMTAGTAGTFAKQSIAILNGDVSEQRSPVWADDLQPEQPCADRLCQHQVHQGRRRQRRHLHECCKITPTASDPNGSVCAPQIFGNEETALRVAIRYARSLGLTVSFKPFVVSPEGFVLAGYTTGSGAAWLPTSPAAFFDLWKRTSSTTQK